MHEAPQGENILVFTSNGSMEGRMSRSMFLPEGVRPGNLLSLYGWLPMPTYIKDNNNE